MYAHALLLLIAVAAPAAAQLPADSLPTDTSRRKGLWIYVEDTNDWMSCYGDEIIETPNIDALAARGTRFTRAYMPAGVCSPTRSAIITGMHQTSIGAHQHYSSVEVWRGIEMDEWDPNYLGVRTIPEILRLAGYHTFNEGKLHYNFVYDIEQIYDNQVGRMNFQGAKAGRCWNGNNTKQPFFGQIQMTGGKTRAKRVVDRAKVKVPPYYPDHPTIREAIGYIGTKIIDHKRACMDVKELETLLGELNSHSLDPLLKATRQTVRDSLLHIENEQTWLEGNGKIPTPGPLPLRDEDVRIGTAHLIGYRLGEKIYKCLVAGKVKRSEVRKLFETTLRDPADASQSTWLNWAKR